MLDEDWRKERLLEVRAMYFETLPELVEGMMQYRLDGEIFAHLNAQKAYVGVYLGELERIDPGVVLRGKMNCGKSCLRLRKWDDPEVVRALVSAKAVIRRND